MKKILTMGVVALAAVCANAASVDWSYTGTADQANYTVYAFSAAVAAQYDAFADLIAAAGAGTGTVAAHSGRTGTTYYTDNTTLSGVSDKLYLVVVSGTDATEYKYGSVSTSGYTYNPDAQESSPGALKIPASAITSTGTIGSVPEPTSGLLLLLGVAGLALKRKRA